jgi:hypothetical protein
MGEAFLSLLAVFELAFDQAGLGFLHVRLTSLNLSHYNGRVLQGADGLVVVHVFSLMQLLWSLMKTPLAVC